MKKTIKIYDKDSYTSDFTALVLSCEKSGSFFDAVMDQTAFFPEGGGQYGDTGSLVLPGGTRLAVLDTQIDDEGLIHHHLNGPVPAGTAVAGEVDFETRFTRMQSHSGEHIVSGLVHSEYGYENIGFHLGDDDVTCDYNGILDDAQIAHIEEFANEAVFKNIEIICEYPDPALLPAMEYRSKLDLTENVRIVTIPGIDVCACCAPHVHRTGEIGLIKITGSEKSHGGTRLHLCIGRRALEDYRIKQNNISVIINVLSARQFETGEAVAKLAEKNKELEHGLGLERAKQAELVLDTVEPRRGNIVVYLKDISPDTLMQLAKGGMEKTPGLFVALTGAGKRYRYIITAETIPLAKYIREINAALNGRGGGKDHMVQGAFETDLETIKTYFANNNMR